MAGDRFGTCIRVMTSTAIGLGEERKDRGTGVSHVPERLCISSPCGTFSFPKRGKSLWHALMHVTSHGLKGIALSWPTVFAFLGAFPGATAHQIAFTRSGRSVRAVVMEAGLDRDRLLPGA